jgi:hypothetical protein
MQTVDPFHRRRDSAVVTITIHSGDVCDWCASSHPHQHTFTDHGTLIREDGE